MFLYGALDSHPFFPSHIAPGRCSLSAAVASALAGVVSAFAEPSGWCTPLPKKKGSIDGPPKILPTDPWAADPNSAKLKMGFFGIRASRGPEKPCIWWKKN